MRRSHVTICSADENMQASRRNVLEGAYLVLLTALDPQTLASVCPTIVNEDLFT